MATVKADPPPTAKDDSYKEKGNSKYKSGSRLLRYAAE
jgi:hypothetical protein